MFTSYKQLHVQGHDLEVSSFSSTLTPTMSRDSPGSAENTELPKKKEKKKRTLKVKFSILILFYFLKVIMQFFASIREHLF